MTMTMIPPAAPTGQGTPRSLEVLTGYLQAEVPCPHCHARPGAPCRWQGLRSVHLGRFLRALIAEQITPRELEVLAAILPKDGGFTSATIVRRNGSR